MQNRWFVFAAALSCCLLGMSGIVVAEDTTVQDEHFEVTGQSAALKGLILAEGDIIVGRENNSPGTSSSEDSHRILRGLGLSNGLSLWPNGIALYELDSDIDDAGRAAVIDAVDHWNTNSSITLVERTSPDAPAGTDFIKFVKGPGCASWVGRQGLEQEIWVSNYCTTGSMIHEIGHALGLLHEHTRADRDQFVEVLWENIQQDKMFNFEISGAGAADLGQYDYDSIMHYGEYFFSMNGQPTIRPLDDSKSTTIGQREKASQGDLANIAALYSTDLALSASTDSSGDQFQITLQVTNQGTNGAHGIAIELEGESRLSGFNGDDQWSCVNQAGKLVCKLPLLPSGASSQVNLYADTQLDIDVLDLKLVSKTKDLNLSNNGGDQPAIGGAVGDAFPQDGANISSGGGALDRLLLIGLLLVLLHRFSRLVIASGPDLSHHEANAHSCFSTPPGRASRCFQGIPR